MDIKNQEDILLPELWIKIFKYLTPVDLCFSVSPVNYLFYNLSQDNQLWSQFKSDVWDENTTFSYQNEPRTRIHNSPKKVNLFKSIYINWIREHGKRAKDANDLPKWPEKEGKRKYKLAIAGDIALKNDKQFDEIFLEKHGVSTTENGLLSLQGEFFSNKEISLKNHKLPGHRCPPHNFMGYKGLFWCSNKIRTDEYSAISYHQRNLDRGFFDTQIIVLDYSSFCEGPEYHLDEKTKNWLKSLGVEFIEGKNIGDALSTMIKLLDTKYNLTYPKYLPTTAEFEKYVYKPDGDPNYY